jgi:hypothetical protein
MKKHILVLGLIIFATLSVFSLTAQTATRTFSKSFNVTNTPLVRLDLPGTVEVREWDNSSLRFEITISLPSGNASMLNQLAEGRRYDLMAADKDGALAIGAPNLSRPVKLKGQDLKEVITFVVFRPKNVEIEVVSPATTAVVPTQK